jgi:hypothetical protein
MQEICQSGSEGGAKLTFVPTPIFQFFPQVVVTLTHWFLAIFAIERGGESTWQEKLTGS